MGNYFINSGSTYTDNLALLIIINCFDNIYKINQESVFYPTEEYSIHM